MLHNEDLDAAKSHIGNLSKRDRNNPEPRNYRGCLYKDINSKLRQGQLHDALESINTLIGYYPKDANYYYYRGQYMRLWKITKRPWMIMFMLLKPQKCSGDMVSSERAV